MGLDSHRGAEDGDGRPPAPRHHRHESHDWKTLPAAPRDSLPHPRGSQVHRPGRRTSRSSSRTWDATADSMMPPPPHLARASTDVYRRPRHWMAYDDGGDCIGGQRRSARDASPAYVRRAAPAEYSGYSSTSGLAYGGDVEDGGGGGDDDDDDDQIEVVEVVDDDSPRYRADGPSSRDDYTVSSVDRRYLTRHTRQRQADDEMMLVRRRRPPFSDGGSPARQSSRTADRSGSSLRGRRRPPPDVIEDSRPPVSSQRAVVVRRHRSAERIPHEDRPRGSSVVRSGRGRAGSVSGGPAGILGSIFGVPLSPRASPEKQAKEPKAKRVDCVICMEDVSPSKAARLKCGHAMCRPCLERIFKLSVTDPQHMPPRCCTHEHIPLRHVDRLFDDGFKRTWNRKFAEFSTKNRLYCPSRKCGEWIKPANIRRENGRKVARCSRCRTKACAVCNGKWHGGDDCPKDEETARLLAQAQEEGWKRCYRCKAMVELKEGCNHMTCRCGAEFCMICGAKWRGCDCPWFTDGGFPSDVLEHMNVPMAQMRGEARDTLDGDGRRGPGELRGHHAVAVSLPVRPRPRSYQEEMLLRRLQEHRDAEMARQLQYGGDGYYYYGDGGDGGDDDDMMGGVGDVHGVGNAAGHLMNDDYRRVSMLWASPPPLRPAAATTTLDRDRDRDRDRHRDRHRERDRGADYAGDGGGRARGRARGSRGGSMERRLADRLSETRPGLGPRAAAMGPLGSPLGSPLGPSMAPPMRPPPAPMGPAPDGAGMARPAGRGLRQHSIEAEPAARSRRRGREERPRSSDLAGLNGLGQGMTRVSQWMSFVEPGIPDGESTVGHA